MQLIVLGMHRSGTSALARVLNLMGCYAGDESAFNPTQPDNPKGYWERRDVWALNERTLALLSASWCRVGDLDLAQLSQAARRDLEGRARGVVGRLDPHRPWMIKDPRLCLLLPIWRPALDRPVCVLIYRHPLEVVRSLGTRDGFSSELSLALWERYVLGSLATSADLPRLLVSHRRLMQDPSGTVEELLAELGRLGVRGLHPPGREELRAFVDPSLYRERLDDRERALLSGPAADLYGQLEDGSALQLDSLPPLSESARSALERHQSLLPPQPLVDAASSGDDGLGESDHDVDQLQDALEETLRHAQELEALNTLILRSRRWRLGNSLGEWFRRLTRRPKQPPAEEHAERMREALRRWRTDLVRRGLLRDR
jgi:hypothetical protein